MTVDFILDTMRSQGRFDALQLILAAPDMTGTELIAEEIKIPAWSPTADYSGQSPGVPGQDEGQVWTLIIPHNAAGYSGRPAQLRALWGLAHTKDPAKAKSWVAPYGISGLYMVDECCTYINPADGLVHVLRNLYENNEYPPYTLNVEHRWQDLGPAEEVLQNG